MTANGNKIFRIGLNGGGSYGEIIMSDSFNFCPMSLSAMSKALSLNVMDKPWFPHGFNKPSNYNYAQNGLPPIEDY